MTIPLKEHIAERFQETMTRMDDLRDHMKDLRQADQLAVQAALAAAEKAVETAKVASDEHLRVHNNVIDSWKEDRASFVTRQQREEDRQAEDERFKKLEGILFKAMGGFAVVAVIGVSNLVKVWGG